MTTKEPGDTQGKVRVLVADDHDLFRRGLIDLLSEQPEIEVVGEARNGIEAKEMAQALEPDMVFMDLRMPKVTGIEATAWISTSCPNTKVVMLTVSEEPEALYRALSVGAKGYILKTSSPREILDCFWQVAQGWVVISPIIASRLLSLQPPKETGHVEEKTTKTTSAPETQLSEREEEVLKLIATGLHNNEISEKLSISENTVKSHVKSILTKLQVGSRREASAQAEKLGLISKDRSP